MLDVANSVADVLYRLGFANATDLAAGGYVTQTELYQWADEAAQKIAYASGIFTTYDSSVSISGGAANLPTAHVFTLAAWLGSTWVRITPVRELWALDSNWTATGGSAGVDGQVRASYDAGAVGTVTVYPSGATGTLNQLCAEYPATIAYGSSTISLPTVLQDWFSYKIMAGARGKESDSSMPEMADHFEERAKMYEQIIDHLFGTGQ